MTSTTTIIRDVPLSKLVPSEKNVRRTHREIGIEQLAASIAAHGLLQSLSVRPVLDKDGEETGRYAVCGGGRRLAALKLLAKRKQIAKSYAVPYIVSAGDEEEVSLAENVVPLNLHPADQFEAFKRLADEQGFGAEEVAARFGLTAHLVRQRLRLGAISPKLMQVYREGGLTMDQMMAFAITEDHARQEQVYDDLRWNKEPSIIRRALMEGFVRGGDRRAVFVGPDAYEAAGGEIIRDLFAEDGSGYFADAGLLDRLAAEKLAGIAAEVQAAEGWKWAQSSIDYPHARHGGALEAHGAELSRPRHQGTDHRCGAGRCLGGGGRADRRQEEAADGGGGRAASGRYRLAARFAADTGNSQRGDGTGVRRCRRVEGIGRDR